MRKLICIVLVLLLLLGVTACGASNPSPSQTQAAPSQTPSTAAPAPETEATDEAFAPDTEGPAPDTAEPAPDTQVPDPDEKPFPTLPPVSEDFPEGVTVMTLGFQWTEVFPEFEEENSKFLNMDEDEAREWYAENGAHYYFVNEAGDALDVNPFGPDASEVTSMEYEIVRETTGLEPWVLYEVPYSREISFRPTRNVRPSSISVQWDDSMVELWVANAKDVQLTTAGVYMDDTDDAGESDGPMAFELKFILSYGDIGQRWLTASAPDSEAFLLTRDGNYITVTCKGECAVNITDRTDGKADVLLDTRVPAGETWYVLDLTAAELTTGYEE
ncbi:MAG: hypothetical protein IKI02_01185 [Oscillospiraceae bacterium]|nr:hypothetical protein [Oscillospiraceae bacterium]